MGSNRLCGSEDDDRSTADSMSTMLKRSPRPRSRALFGHVQRGPCGPSSARLRPPRPGNRRRGRRTTRLLPRLRPDPGEVPSAEGDDGGAAGGLTYHSDHKRRINPGPSRERPHTAKGVRPVSKKASATTAERLRAELVQLDRDIQGVRGTLQSMRVRRTRIRRIRFSLSRENIFPGHGVRRFFDAFAPGSWRRRRRPSVGDPTCLSWAGAASGPEGRRRAAPNTHSDSGGPAPRSKAAVPGDKPRPVPIRVRSPRRGQSKNGGLISDKGEAS